MFHLSVGTSFLTTHRLYYGCSYFFSVLLPYEERRCPDIQDAQSLIDSKQEVEILFCCFFFHKEEKVQKILAKTQNLCMSVKGLNGVFICFIYPLVLVS